MRRRSPGLPRSSRSGCVKSLAVGAGVIALAVLVLGGAGGWLVFYRPATEVVAGRPVQVEIDEGSSTRAIARRLAEAGVVRNENMFRVQTRLKEADGKLRAGVYDLSTGMPYDLVIGKLVAGPPIKYVTVTVPEGFVLEQIAARLEKRAGIPASEFMQLAKVGAGEFAQEHPYVADAFRGSLEGYLFPKTYRIKEGSGARDVIEMMLDQFDEEIDQVDVEGASSRGMTLEKLVVAASMIERETRVDKERPLVSSVIYNRLDRGMRLEIDATIEYVLPGNRFRLRYSDLRIDSPYNTYRNKGLPPGPISNPGLASLKAAADPAETDYIYYVLTGKNGTHTFATNERDFLEAKAVSKEVFGK